MKRTTLIGTFLFLFVIFLLIFSFIHESRAESDFVYRNGVQFGDSIEMVLEKETFTKPQRTNKKLAYVDVKLSGLSGSTLVYDFLSNELESIIVYYLEDNKDLEKQTENYAMIEDGLFRKYGESLDYSVNTKVKVQYNSDNFQILQDTERELKYINGNEYTVFISHMLVKQETINNTYFIHVVSYERQVQANSELVIDSDL